jgi:hypothetical protein
MIEILFYFTANDTNITDDFIYNCSDEIINDEIKLRLIECIMFQ